MISDLAIRLFNVVLSERVSVHVRVRGESIPVCVCVCVCSVLVGFGCNPPVAFQRCCLCKFALFLLVGLYGELIKCGSIRAPCDPDVTPPGLSILRLKTVYGAKKLCCFALTTAVLFVEP